MDAIALEHRVVLQGQRWPFPAVVRQCSTTGRSRRRSHQRLNSSQLQSETYPESSSGEVDPVHRDRLRIAHEEYLRQLHLEDAVPQWKVFGWFTVVADHANRHPVRTFRVQWRVFLAFLPQSHPLPVVGTQHRSIERDVAVRGPEVLQIFQVRTQQIRFDQPTSSLSCFGPSASGLLDAVFTPTPHLCFILEIDV